MHVADPLEGHTSKTVDQALHELRTHAVEMGGLVIDQVGSAVKALLERVGDESKKIARFAAKLGAVAPHDPVTAVARSLRHMATLSTTLLRSAVRALDEANPTLARDVLDRDRELDEEFASALRQVMSFVIEDQQFLRPTVDTVFALKGLERIGDHAKNVAEQVLYMVEGERPRKQKKGDRG